MPRNPAHASPAAAHERAGAIEQMLKGGQTAQAIEAGRAAIEQWPQNIEFKILLGHALCRASVPGEALGVARQAIAMAPGDPAPRMLEIKALLQSGDNANALQALEVIDSHCRTDHPRLLQDMAQHFTVLGRHRDAAVCHERARKLTPDDPAAVYNHATSLIALGEMDAAEQALDRVIELAPDDADAWYNRATLRRQSEQHNHVAQIETRIARTAAEDPAQVPLNYALAKELEDLKQYPNSFVALERGATARRRRLSYDVQDDVDTMDLIGTTFDHDWLAAAAPGHEDARPIFIVGLPRSGTTLVDRILSSHDDVHSRGETTDLALSVVREAGAAQGKADLMQRSRKLNPAALGQRYCDFLPPDSTQRQIDKTPANFLYLGLAAAALPQARIIHVRRKPMDVCYAMYKTLFRMAYPFSYALDDLGYYWLAWHRLMLHWQATLPAAQYLEVDYEDLVARQEPVSRQIVAHAGLDWQDDCLSFERNRSPSLTASAAQVRQPIYSSSVGLWQRYRQQLAPLEQQLIAAGINPDAPWETDS